MGKIYKGQTKLIINVALETDITGCTVKLKYEKPNGELGQFDTTITDAALGNVQFIVSDATELDVVGKWVFWAYITYGDGKVAAGEPFTIELYKEGK